MPRNPVPGRAKPAAAPAEAATPPKRVVRAPKVDETIEVVPAAEVADTPAEDAPAS
jgi:hypothetical protein